MSPSKRHEKPAQQASPERAAAAMVAEAKARGLALTDPDGLLKILHRGRAGNGAERGNDRASRSREESGESGLGLGECAERHAIEDRALGCGQRGSSRGAAGPGSMFSPQIVKKRQRRLPTWTKSCCRYTRKG
ncbi:predicted protein [Streptomyces sp. AA4]|nr:predicted protein [Streptomyces sp. AA4]